MPTPRQYIDHIAGVWAKTSALQHNHHRGWQNCPICGKHDPNAEHDHSKGLDGCRACMRVAPPTCGLAHCPICSTH